jgi:hypothetical protein
MPRTSRNSNITNHSAGGNGGDDDKNRRDDKPREHAQPYRKPLSRPAKIVGANANTQAGADQALTNAQIPPLAEQLPHPIKASIVDAPLGRTINPPIVTTSQDRTKPPSIRFENLPVPANVKEIKIKAQKLPNGFSFVLTWDEDALQKLEDAVNQLNEGAGVKPTSHVEKAEMRRQDDDNSRGGGIA